MSKKVKILVISILLIIGIFIANSSYALTVPRSAHYDPWTGLPQFFAAGGGETATGATLCAQKMGALRFTPAGLSETYHEEGIGGPTEIHENCKRNWSSFCKCN